MNQKIKQLINISAGFLIVTIIFVTFLPQIIETVVPAQYWGYLPESLIATMGERSDYLPAVAEANAAEISAADLVADIEIVAEAASPTPLPPTPTAIPTEAAAAESQAAAEESGSADQAPSPTPLPPTATPIPPTPTPEPLPISHRIDGLENEAQKFNNCGPTNATLVLNFWGDPTDQLTAASYLKPNSQDRNVSPWQVSDYVNQETALSSITRADGDQELLKRLITAGFPVVIEKGYDPNVANAKGWYGHYLTVFGYDDEQEIFNTMDTFLGPFREGDVQAGFTLEDGRPYTYEYIDYYWQQFAYTFYVIYPPEKENEVFTILGDDLLDDVTMWQNAAQRAQSDIDEDAENQFAWFNLGTSLTRLGEITGEQTFYENGATAFDQSLALGLPSRMLWYQHRPYIAYMKTGRYQDMINLADATLVDPGGRNVEETYYYKGHALSFQGDLNGAANAFEQALELNEFFYPAQFALDYVNSIR